MARKFSITKLFWRHNTNRSISGLVLCAIILCTDYRILQVFEGLKRIHFLQNPHQTKQNKNRKMQSKISSFFKTPSDSSSSAPKSDDPPPVYDDLFGGEVTNRKEPEIRVTYQRRRPPNPPNRYGFLFLFFFPVQITFHFNPVTVFGVSKK